MSNQSAEAVFDALGEPVRRRILELLHDGPAAVGQLAQRLPVGRPAVSKHLRVLSNAGLVEHSSAGTRNLYVLAPGGMAAALPFCDALVSGHTLEALEEVADEIAGKDKVARDTPPLMGAEDFAYMLEERPGAFIYVGNGDSAMLHHPAYDFNDEAIPLGTSYWVRLAERALAG